MFKLISRDLTLWQIFALRGLLALPLFLLVARLRGYGWSIWKASLGLWPLLRGLCLTMTFLAFYAAIPFLNLSTVGAANYVAPIFVAILSAFVIGEPVGRLGWMGVFLGFAGVVVLLQPGTEAFSPFALLPICGAAFYAVGHIITRTRCATVRPEALAFALGAMMCLAGCVISLVLKVMAPRADLVEAFPYIFGQWAPVGVVDWGVLLVLAVFTVVIGIMLAGAYQAAPPAIIATFEYSYLVFVVVWDVLIFGNAVTPTSLTGMAMIVGAGLLVIRARR